MRPFVERAGHVIRRLPFTLITLALLVVLGAVTNTCFQPISVSLLARIGFSPVDVRTWRWDRLFTSALVTSGAHGFWLALVGVGICAGAAEWLAGSWRAALGFWGVHIVTLLASTGVALLLLHLGVPGGAELTVEADVGPSAGTFGCLGLAVARLPRPWNTRIGSATVGVLFIVLLLPLAGLQVNIASISSNIAHLIAFPLGWLVSGVGKKP